MATAPDLTQPEPLLPAHLRRPARVAALVLILVVYLGALSPHWLPGNDSALYQLLGRSLARGEGYSLFDKPSAFVPPGFPALLAAAQRLGVPWPQGFNIMMLLMALCTIALAWRLVRAHVGEETALAVLLLFALGSHMHDVSLQLLSDGPFLLLVMLGLWLWTRWARTGAGPIELGTLALAAAGWMRIVAMPLAVGAAIGLMLQPVAGRRWRKWANAGGLILLVAGTMLVFYLRYAGISATQANVPGYGHHLTGMASKGVGTVLKGLVEHLYETGEVLPRLMTSQRFPSWIGWIVFGVPMLLGLGLRLAGGWRIGALAVLAYVGAIVLLRQPIVRYLLPVGPLLVLYWADGVYTIAWKIVERMRQARQREDAELAAQTGETPAPSSNDRRMETQAHLWPLCLLLMLAILNLPRDARRIFWIHHPDFETVYRGGIRDMRDMADFLEQQPSGTRFLSATNGFVLALWSGRDSTAVSKTLLRQPDAPDRLAELLRQEDIRLLIFEPGNEPPAFTEFRLREGARGRLTQRFRSGEMVAYEYRP